jgi:hypothetical protein
MEMWKKYLLKMCMLKSFKHFGFTRYETVFKKEFPAVKTKFKKYFKDRDKFICNLNIPIIYKIFSSFV